VLGCPGAGPHGTRSRTQLHLILFGAVIVPADGTRAATVEKRRLRYVAAFVGQLSDKPLLASIIHVGCRNALHNGGSRNYVLIRFDDSVVRQCGEFELRQTKLRSRKIADEQFYTDRIWPTELADTDKVREARAARS
jgi:hypothetical protein